MQICDGSGCEASESSNGCGGDSGLVLKTPQTRCLVGKEGAISPWKERWSLSPAGEGGKAGRRNAPQLPIRSTAESLEVFSPEAHSAKGCPVGARLQVWIAPVIHYGSTTPHLTAKYHSIGCPVCHPRLVLESFHWFCLVRPGRFCTYCISAVL